MVRRVAGGGDTKGEGRTDRLCNSVFPTRIRICPLKTEAMSYSLSCLKSQENL